MIRITFFGRTFVFVLAGTAASGATPSPSALDATGPIPGSAVVAASVRKKFLRSMQFIQGNQAPVALRWLNDSRIGYVGSRSCTAGVIGCTGLRDEYLRLCPALHAFNVTQGNT
jgi:hypothetical protein